MKFINCFSLYLGVNYYVNNNCEPLKENDQIEDSIKNIIEIENGKIN